MFQKKAIRRSGHDKYTYKRKDVGTIAAATLVWTAEGTRNNERTHTATQMTNPGGTPSISKLPLPTITCQTLRYQPKRSKIIREAVKMLIWDRPYDRSALNAYEKQGTSVAACSQWQPPKRRVSCTKNISATGQSRIIISYMVMEWIHHICVIYKHVKTYRCRCKSAARSCQ